MDTKKCGGCEEVKLIAQFNIKGKYKNGNVRYQSFCKLCNSAASKIYYASNREKHIKDIGKRKQKYIERNRLYVYNFLLEHPCIDCRDPRPYVLDFDHVTDDKHSNISKMIGRPVSLKKLKEEIKKCGKPIKISKGE